MNAALLIVGVDPAKFQDTINKLEPTKRPPGYDATFAALTQSILCGGLPARIRRQAWDRGWIEFDGEVIGPPLEPDDNYAENVRKFMDQEMLSISEQLARGDIAYRAEPDWSLTTISRKDVVVWLKGRGITTGFFFPNVKSTPDYLNPKHPKYAPKLAAAISAWKAVAGNPQLVRGKSPKAALDKWLREHASDFGLTKRDGSPKAQGIDYVATIANWDQKGGAPKTSGR
ncbi:MAG: hypothetical protein ABL973_04615 [Micropepsaceae bacterium]